MDKKRYTGIGARDTPKEFCQIMTQIAKRLDQYGYTLRSGGAKGADSAFERGSLNKEIFLPYKGFNNNKSDLYVLCKEARLIAAKYHPAWHKCGSLARKFHTRNVYQVLGLDLKTPTNFVICWTKDGKFSGGTGQALRIAHDHGIPIYNLKNDIDFMKLNEFMESLND